MSETSIIKQNLKGVLECTLKIVEYLLKVTGDLIKNSECSLTYKGFILRTDWVSWSAINELCFAHTHPYPRANVSFNEAIRIAYFNFIIGNEAKYFTDCDCLFQLIQNSIRCIGDEQNKFESISFNLSWRGGKGRATGQCVEECKNQIFEIHVAQY